MKNTLIAIMICLMAAGSAVAQTGDKSKVVYRGTDTAIAAKDFGYDVKPKKKYTVAVVVKSAAITVWESHIIAAKRAGANLGVNIVTYAPTKADNVEEQTRILEDLVTAGVDAVVLAPANTDAVTRAVKDLLSAGIVVVYDNTMGPEDLDYLTFVGIDSVEAGVEIAKATGTMMHGKGKLLVLEGVPGQSTSDLRVKGLMEYVARNFPGITAESAVTNWQFDQGRRVTENYITKWGKDLKAVVAVGGNQAEGAVEALKTAGMKGVIVGGFDVQEPQYVAVKNGGETFTVSQDVYDQAYLSVVAAVRALNGDTVPRLIKTPITIVTQGNLDEMDERPEALLKRR
ncbi:MAG: sugar ABC transporter substrate-binding protein [Rhodopila sp.]|nr:sugar ABC transporter substrate-binding protein [Rhodopila sp.]